MKKNALYLLLGLGLLACSSVASATGQLLVEDPSATYTTSSFSNGMSGFSSPELSFNYGALVAPGSGTVTYTYLGSEAGYTNYFQTNGVTDFTNHGVTSLYSSITQTVTTPGVLDFSFATQDPLYSVSNQLPPVTGSPTYGTDQGVFGIAQGGQVNGKTYQEFLIYNDPVNGGDHDYNDMVVGVNFTRSTSPVPEPKVYGMMLVGLGLMGFMVRRKKSV
jgi:hypothetical protein